MCRMRAPYGGQAVTGRGWWKMKCLRSPWLGASQVHWYSSAEMPCSPELQTAFHSAIVFWTLTDKLWLSGPDVHSTWTVIKCSVLPNPLGFRQVWVDLHPGAHLIYNTTYLGQSRKVTLRETYTDCVETALRMKPI